MSAKNPHRYDDMLLMSHPVSSKHLPMSMEKRAAQFAPFAALSGYEETIEETKRLTKQRVQLDEQSKWILDQRLQEIRRSQSQQPEITVEYFIPDDKKTGGRYVKKTASVFMVDDAQKEIVFLDGEKISILDIKDIQSSDISFQDEW